MQPASSVASLRDELRRFVIESVRRLVTRFCPDFRIPGSFAGHRIHSDHAAELAWMLGLLKPLGVHHRSDARLAHADSRATEELGLGMALAHRLNQPRGIKIPGRFPG